jgi:hypothetical protein
VSASVSKLYLNSTRQDEFVFFNDFKSFFKVHIQCSYFDLF